MLCLAVPISVVQTSRLLGIHHSVWKQSYNACPTVLYSIDIGSVLVFTVQIDDTSDETDVSILTLKIRRYF